MRISAELLSQAEQRTNPLQERELVLREWGIPSIENMGAIVAGSSSAASAIRGGNGGNDNEPLDAMDFCNNRIVRLENFPRMRRLSHLLCSGNLIESIHAVNIAKNLPNLKSLTLSYNNITSLAEVANLGTACPKLEFLSLVGNPVTRRQHYRLYTIHRIPTLKVLDFSKVKPAERSRAERLATSAAGAALESDVHFEAQRAQQQQQQQQGASTAKTFEPGEGLEDETFFVVASFTNEEKEQIRELLAKASSAQEVEMIESSVRRGVLPAALLTNNGKRKRGEDATADTTVTNRVTDDDETPAAKRK